MDTELINAELENPESTLKIILAQFSYSYMALVIQLW